MVHSIYFLFLFIPVGKASRENTTNQQSCSTSIEEAYITSSNDKVASVTKGNKPFAEELENTITQTFAGDMTNSVDINSVKDTTDSTNTGRVDSCLTSATLLKASGALPNTLQFVLPCLFACNLCTVAFTKFEQLKEHNQRKHNSENLFFPLRNILPNIPKPNPTIDDISDAFSNLSLRARLSEVLVVPVKKASEKLSCSKCQKTFDDKPTLQKHMAAAHKKFECHLCSKVFRQVSSFNRHLSTHFIPSFSCRYCEQRFPSRVQLLDHVNIHRQVKIGSTSSYSIVPGVNVQHTGQQKKKGELDFLRDLVSKVASDSLPETSSFATGLTNGHFRSSQIAVSGYRPFDSLPGTSSLVTNLTNGHFRSTQIVVSESRLFDTLPRTNSLEAGLNKENFRSNQIVVSENRLNGGSASHDNVLTIDDVNVKGDNDSKLPSAVENEHMRNKGSKAVDNLHGSTATSLNMTMIVNPRNEQILNSISQYISVANTNMLNGNRKSCEHLQENVSTSVSLGSNVSLLHEKALNSMQQHTALLLESTSDKRQQDDANHRENIEGDVMFDGSVNLSTEQLLPARMKDKRAKNKMASRLKNPLQKIPLKDLYSNHCFHCPMVFFSAAELKKHVKYTHDPVDVNRGINEHDEFPHKQQNDMQQKSTADLGCALCCVEFSSKDDVENHLESYHGLNSKEYQGKQEKKIQDLSSEIQCLHCGTLLASKDALKKHFSDIHDIVSHDILFHCYYCGRNFTSPINLVIHMGEKHRQVSLMYDKYVEERKKSSETEMIQGDNAVIEDENSESMKDSSSGIYKCEFCDKSYLSQKLLTEHFTSIHQNHANEGDHAICQNSVTSDGNDTSGRIDEDKVSTGESHTNSDDKDALRADCLDNCHQSTAVYQSDLLEDDDRNEGKDKSHKNSDDEDDVRGGYISIINQKDGNDQEPVTNRNDTEINNSKNKKDQKGQYKLNISETAGDIHQKYGSDQEPAISQNCMIPYADGTNSRKDDRIDVDADCGENEDENGEVKGDRNQCDSCNRQQCHICTGMYQALSYLNSNKESLCNSNLEKKRSTCIECHRPCEAHEERNTKPAPVKYECDKCSRYFNTELKFQQHKESVHEAAYVKCDICHYSFSSRHLKKHMERHSHGKKFKCDKCDKVFFSQENLTMHLHRHSGKGRVTCEICGKSYAGKVELRIHMRRHTGDRTHVCGICNQVYYRKFEFDHHMKTHRGEKSHKCRFCPKKFVSRHRLRRHIEKVHWKEKDHVITEENQTLDTHGEITEELNQEEILNLTENSTTFKEYANERNQNLSGRGEISDKDSSDTRHQEGLHRTNQNTRSNYEQEYNEGENDENSHAKKKNFEENNKIPENDSPGVRNQEGLCKDNDDTGNNNEQEYFANNGEENKNLDENSKTVENDFSTDRFLGDNDKTVIENEPGHSIINDELWLFKFVCHECRRMFTTKYYYIKHLEHGHKEKQCAKTSFECIECGRVLATKYGLKKHLERVHRKDKKNVSKGNKKSEALQILNKCLTCEKNFSSLYNLRRHRANVHKAKSAEQRVYEENKESDQSSESVESDSSDSQGSVEIDNLDSENSSQVQHTASSRNQHERTCPECGRKFSCKYNVKRHLEKVHYASHASHKKRSQKAYRCVACGKSFTTKFKLEKHVASVHTATLEMVQCAGCGVPLHKNSSQPVSNESDSNLYKTKKRVLSTARSYQCKQCSNKFRHMYCLKRHMQRHAEKRFYCALCQTLFVSIA